jgi:hypothetical protein
MAHRDDESYRLAAVELYRLNVERLKAVTAIQADYGKWLIATLSVIHTGALYAIATAHLASNVKGAYAPFLVGQLLVLASGLSTWTNFSLVMSLMEDWTDPFMLTDDARWPKLDGPFKFWIPATMVISIVAGVLSALCLLWGAALLMH